MAGSRPPAEVQEVYPGSAYSWTVLKDGQRSRQDRVGVVIHTCGEDFGRSSVGPCTGELCVGQGRFRFNDPERSHGKRRGRERDPVSGLEFSRQHDGFCGFMQTAMMRAAGVEPNGFTLAHVPDVAGSKMAEFVMEFGRELAKVVAAAVALEREERDPVGHLAVRCRIGRHRSNACAHWIYQFLQDHGYQVRLRCHALKKTELDDRGPCGCLFAKCQYIHASDKRWMEEMLRARRSAAATFTALARALLPQELLDGDLINRDIDERHQIIKDTVRAEKIHRLMRVRDRTEEGQEPLLDDEDSGDTEDEEDQAERWGSTVEGSRMIPFPRAAQGGASSSRDPPTAELSEQRRRRVVFIGIAGASGVGKTTLAKKLAADLGSPLYPLNQDQYIGGRGALDPKPMKTDWGKCWDNPDAMDFKALLDDVTEARLILATAAKMPKELRFGLENRGQHNLVRKGGENVPLGPLSAAAPPVYVVAEGFQLFINKDLCREFDVHIWLTDSLEHCGERRLARRNKKGKSSKESPEDFMPFYKGVVWNEYAKCSELQVRNAAASGSLIRIAVDGRSAEEVRMIARDRCRAALGLGTNDQHEQPSMPGSREKKNETPDPPLQQWGALTTPLAGGPPTGGRQANRSRLNRADPRLLLEELCETRGLLTQDVVYGQDPASGRYQRCWVKVAGYPTFRGGARSVAEDSEKEAAAAAYDFLIGNANRARGARPVADPPLQQRGAAATQVASGPPKWGRRPDGGWFDSSDPRHMLEVLCEDRGFSLKDVVYGQLPTSGPFPRGWVRVKGYPKFVGLPRRSAEQSQKEAAAAAYDFLLEDPNRVGRARLAAGAAVAATAGAERGAEPSDGSDEETEEVVDLLDEGAADSDSELQAAFQAVLAESYSASSKAAEKTPEPLGGADGPSQTAAPKPKGRARRTGAAASWEQAAPEEAKLGSPAAVGTKDAAPADVEQAADVGVELKHAFEEYDRAAKLVAEELRTMDRRVDVDFLERKEAVDTAQVLSALASRSLKGFEKLKGADLSGSSAAEAMRGVKRLCEDILDREAMFPRIVQKANWVPEVLEDARTEAMLEMSDETRVRRQLAVGGFTYTAGNDADRLYNRLESVLDSIPNLKVERHQFKGGRIEIVFTQALSAAKAMLTLRCYQVIEDASLNATDLTFALEECAEDNAKRLREQAEAEARRKAQDEAEARRKAQDEADARRSSPSDGPQSEDEGRMASEPPREKRGRGAVKFADDPEVVPLQAADEENEVPSEEEPEEDEAGDREVAELHRLAVERKWHDWDFMEKMRNDQRWPTEQEREARAAQRAAEKEGAGPPPPRQRSNLRLGALQTLQRTLISIRSEEVRKTGEGKEILEKLKGALSGVVTDKRALDAELARLKDFEGDVRQRFRLAATAALKPRFDQDLEQGVPQKKALKRMKSRVRTLEFLAELEGKLEWRERLPAFDPNAPRDPPKRKPDLGTRIKSRMVPAQKAFHKQKRKQGRSQQEHAFLVLGGVEEPTDEYTLERCEEIAGRVSSLKKLLRVMNREWDNLTPQGVVKLGLLKDQIAERLRLSGKQGGTHEATAQGEPEPEEQTESSGSQSWGQWPKKWARHGDRDSSWPQQKGSYGGRKHADYDAPWHRSDSGWTSSTAPRGTWHEDAPWHSGGHYQKGSSWGAWGWNDDAGDEEDWGWWQSQSHTKTKKKKKSHQWSKKEWIEWEHGYSHRSAPYAHGDQRDSALGTGWTRGGREQSPPEIGHFDPRLPSPYAQAATLALPSLQSAGMAFEAASGVLSSLASVGVMPWVAGYWGYRASNVVDDVAERASFVVTEAVDDANAAVRDVLQEVTAAARWAFRAVCAVWGLRLLRIVQSDVCAVARVSRQTAAKLKKFSWLWPSPFAQAAVKESRWAAVAKAVRQEEAFMPNRATPDVARPKQICRFPFEVGGRYRFVYSGGQRAGRAREVVVRAVEADRLRVHDVEANADRAYVLARISSVERVIEAPALDERCGQVSKPAERSWWETLFARRAAASPQKGADNGSFASVIGSAEGDSPVPGGVARDARVTKGTKDPAPGSNCEVGPLMPGIDVLINPHIQPALLEAIEQAKREISFMAYCFDEEGVVEALAKRAKDGLNIRGVLDRDQMMQGSCARQPLRVEDLIISGVSLRMLRPRGNSRFSAMHAKTWVFDERTVITGSANTTRNSFENNYEQCLMIQCSGHPLTGVLRSEFENLWDRSETLNVEDCRAASGSRRTRSEEIARQRSSASSSR